MSEQISLKSPLRRFVMTMVITAVVMTVLTMSNGGPFRGMIWCRG